MQLAVFHVCTVLRSLWRVSTSSSFLIVRYRRLSSANSLIWVPSVRFWLISLMYARKRRGPRTVPWGTPERTGAGDDLAPSTRTVSMRLDKNYRIQRRRDSPMPREESFVRRISWSTLSRAFEKSICSLFLRQRLKSLTVVISCDTQLRFF